MSLVLPGAAGETRVPTEPWQGQGCCPGDPAVLREMAPSNGHRSSAVALLEDL